MSDKAGHGMVGIRAWVAALLSDLLLTRLAQVLWVMLLFTSLSACGGKSDGVDCESWVNYWYCIADNAKDPDDDGISREYDCNEGDASVRAIYVAVDGDGDGVAGEEDYGPAPGCVVPAGYSDVLGDCDDDDPDKITEDIWFEDLDGDTWGTGVGVEQCASEAGYATRGEDCDDADETVNPGAEEQPRDGLDNDCDGRADDAAPQGSYSASDAKASFEGSGDDELSYAFTAVGGLDLAIGSPGAEDSRGAAVGAVDLYSGPILSDEDAGERVATRLWGAHDGDRAGAAMTGPGDLDGDGYDELIVGAPGFESGAWGGASGPEGAAYLVYGPVEPGSTVLLEDSRHVAVLTASESGSGLGTAMTEVGDVTGDGLPDFAVSAPTLGGRWVGVPTQGGKVYLLEGVAEHEQEIADVAFASLEGEEAYGWLGAVVAGGKDLNGDGTPDLVVGAPTDRSLGRDPEADSLHATKEGVVWVLLEPISDDAAISLRASTWLNGPETSALGSAISLIDDVDGDGTADLALGAPFGDTTADDGGAIYLLSGAALDEIDPGDVMSSPALLSVVLPPAASSYLGWAVADAGDIDGDGASDLLCGAPGYDDGRGAAWLLNDPAGGDQLDDASLSVTGPFPYRWTGRTLGAADLNGLGRPDLLVGAVEDSIAEEVDLTPGHLSLFLMDSL